jgi:hypothetical protein
MAEAHVVPSIPSTDTDPDADELADQLGWTGGVKPRRTAKPAEGVVTVNQRLRVVGCLERRPEESR